MERIRSAQREGGLRALAMVSLSGNFRFGSMRAMSILLIGILVSLFATSTCGNVLSMSPVSAPSSASSPTSPLPTSALSLSSSSPTSLPSISSSALASVNFTLALQLSTLFIDAQRSGHLKSNRVAWRGDSGLTDGADVLRDLTGGFYDSGDTTKSTFPMAFGITMLSWGVVEYRNLFAAAGELANTLDSIKWGADYLLKAWVASPSTLYAMVGDKVNDNSCWMRPENMTTDRPSYPLNATIPGSEVAGEVAAALSAAAIAWNPYNATYAANLVSNAASIFYFAVNFTGSYSTSIPMASRMYKSYNGYGDELLWGAVWLFRATGTDAYRQYLLESSQFLGGFTERGEFSWDDKYAAVQILMARNYLANQTLIGDALIYNQYKRKADSFICVYLESNRIYRTPAGLVHSRDDSPLQITISSAFLAVIYADYLSQATPAVPGNGHGDVVQCNSSTFSPAQLMMYAYEQASYILGNNPNKFSYMVGYGARFPVRVHHRGASMADFHTDPTAYPCNESSAFLTTSLANPINVMGALVGGPNSTDYYDDVRTNLNQSQPQFSSGAIWTSLLARLTSPPPQILSTDAGSSASPASSPTVVTNPNCPDPAANGYPGVNYTSEVVFSFVKDGESVAQYRGIIWNTNACMIRDLVFNCKNFIAQDYWMVQTDGKEECRLAAAKPILAIMERYEFGYTQTTALAVNMTTKSYEVAG